MGVFDFDEQSSGGVQVQHPDNGTELESAFGDMSHIDPDTESVSVIDTKKSQEYVHLRVTIPMDFARTLGITPEDDLLMKLYGEEGILVRRP